MIDVTLGDEVRDILTGFTGIVVARIDHLFAARSFLVQPQTLRDGQPAPPLELATSRLRVVQRDALHRDLAEQLGSAGSPSSTPHTP
jgi:hypothetical protein